MDLLEFLFSLLLDLPDVIDVLVHLRAYWRISLSVLAGVVLGVLLATSVQSRTMRWLIGAPTALAAAIGGVTWHVRRG